MEDCRRASEPQSQPGLSIQMVAGWNRKTARSRGQRSPPSYRTREAAGVQKLACRVRAGRKVADLQMIGAGLRSLFLGVVDEGVH